MIRPSVGDDVYEIAEQMRDADKAEVELLAGQSPLEALAVGYVNSAECITGIGKGGELVCMAGVVKTDVKGYAAVWMLSTSAVERNKKALLRDGKKWLARMRKQYGTLANVVTADNSTHVGLIKHLGFTFGSTIQKAGVHKVPALPFKMR